MDTSPVDFAAFASMTDADCHSHIRAARAGLGGRLVILGHHYVRADVYQYADLTGDSLRLARLASATDAEYIVFCGVHFMAEVADIMSKPQQTVILPDLTAGCSMADMADLAKVDRCWRELDGILDADERVTPVTYINSAADLKAFCGRHGGAVCTSSNAGAIAEWAFRRREKILFFPDQHLGRWTGHRMGVPPEEMPVWDPDLENGGLTPEQIRKARLLLWKGCCSVHQVFQPAHIHRFRAEHPDGLVISHPECCFEVCRLSDHVASTEGIVKIIRDAAPGTRWLVGTEFSLVKRLAGEEDIKTQGKIVQCMAADTCICPTMRRINPQRLAWALENLAAGRVVNRITVPEHEAVLAKSALERMLAAS